MNEAGFCLLYPEFYYIEVYYNESQVYMYDIVCTVFAYVKPKV